jgi:hypothetical protein
VETVTIATAAERLGISQDTVRRRIHRGELRAQQAPTPQGFVWQVELCDQDAVTLPAASDAPPSPPVPEPEPAVTQTPPVLDPTAGPPAEVRRLEQLVDVLQEELRRRNDELAARTREIGELHVLLQQAQRALPPVQDAYATPTQDDEAPGQPAGHGDASPRQAPPQSPRRPWWAFWRPVDHVSLTRH